MGLYGYLKKLKKQLRTRKRWLNLAAVVVLVGLAVLLLRSGTGCAAPRHPDKDADIERALGQHRVLYFGIDGTGHLSLYEDEPEEKKVLRTFFQLNVEQLESALPPEAADELRRGIRVRDLAEFNSVLSTYSEFAQSPTEHVMKPSRQ